MYKSLVQFEHTIENFVGQFLIAPNTPTPVAKEILVHFLTLVSQIEEQGKAAMEAQKAASTEQTNPVEEQACDVQA